jgi:hypothetical protein
MNKIITWAHSLEVSHLTTLSAIGVGLLVFSLTAHFTYIINEKGLSQSIKYKTEGLMIFIDKIRVWGSLYWIALCFALYCTPMPPNNIACSVFKIFSFQCHLIAAIAISTGYGVYMIMWLSKQSLGWKKAANIEHIVE